MNTVYSLVKGPSAYHRMKGMLKSIVRVPDKVHMRRLSRRFCTDKGCDRCEVDVRQF
jgi:hypothetical protein